MKKILVTSLITSAVMIAVIAAAVVFMSKGKAENTSLEELDLLENTEYVKEINTSGSEELSIGRNGRILSFGEKSVDEIYNVKSSKAVMSKINKLKKKEKYTFENPLFIWNPFGTNELSLYYYFKDKESTYVKYTIQVEDPDIPDFTRILNTNTDDKVTRTHEYSLTGFVPGCQNYLIVRRYSKSGKMLAIDYYDFYVDKLEEKAATKIKYEDGEKSSGTVSEGLYCICGYNAESKTAPKVIPFYDNSGVIRSAFPIKNYRTDRMEFVNHNMIYSYSNWAFAVVSSIGQVLHTYDLGNYRLHHDFIYNNYGQLWCLATDAGKSSSTVRDCVVSVDMETGKVTKLVDFRTLFPQIVKRAGKNVSSDSLNWIDLNSITRVGSSDIIVSSRELSSIIKIRSVTSGYPKIGYIISDKAFWQKTKYKKYLLLKGAYQDKKWYNLEGDTSELEEGMKNFTVQFGQNGVTYEQARSLGEGQYYLTMLNNNYGDSKTVPSVKYSNFTGVGTAKSVAVNSYYYEYLVDENEGYYGLKCSYELPYTATGGNIFRIDDNTVVNIMKEKTFGEYGKNGQVIRKYSLKAYRVYKYNMKNLWFY